MFLKCLSSIATVLKFKMSLIVALSLAIAYLAYYRTFGRGLWLTFLSGWFLSNSAGAFSNKRFTIGIIMLIHALVAMYALGRNLFF